MSRATSQHLSRSALHLESVDLCSDRLWELLTTLRNWCEELQQRVFHSLSIWARADARAAFNLFPQLAASICASGVDERLLADSALSARNHPRQKKTHGRNNVFMRRSNLHPANFNAFLMRFRQTFDAFQCLANSLVILEARYFWVEIGQSDFVNGNLIWGVAPFVTRGTNVTECIWMRSTLSSRKTQMQMTSGFIDLLV